MTTTIHSVVMFRHQTVVFLLFMLMAVRQTQEQRTMTWQSITHRHNSVYVNYFGSNITQPHNLSFNLEVGYTNELSCEMMLSLDIKAQQPGKNTLLSLLKFKYSMREALNGVRNKFFKIVFESLTKYSNTPKECPLMPGFIWRLHNFSVPIEQFPVILTELNFLIDYKVATPNNDFILLITFKGRVECKERKGVSCGMNLKRG